MAKIGRNKKTRITMTRYNAIMTKISKRKKPVHEILEDMLNEVGKYEIVKEKK